MRTALMLACLALASCAHTGAAVAPNCLPLREWTADEKAALKGAYDALPQGSVLRLAVEDLTKLRQEDRACMAKPVAR